jgi:hypothetical protein
VTLAETQALFHALVTRGPQADPAGLEACFSGNAELAAPERVGIYANMFLWRQVEALRADFPRLATCLGDERFYALCRDYVREHPSEHHDIGRLGRSLPAFLRRHPAPERPDLADLAALEWARREVFLAAPAEPIGRQDLRAVPADLFPKASLRLIPALRLLVLDHAAAALWRRLEAREEAGPVEPGPVAMAVWRSGDEVCHAALDPDEALALEAALSGKPLSRVCEPFARRRDPASSAFAALASWLDEGWVAAVVTAAAADV